MQKRLKVSLEDIFKPIESYLKEVDGLIPEKLKTGISLMDASSLHLFKNSGKKIRASIVILSSGLKGEIPHDIIEIAAAVETFHGASLIHDDIIDQSFLRRGFKTVSSEWGNKIAVLIGDFMYIKAFQTILDDGNPLLIPEVIAVALNMIKGEIYQMEFSGIDSINREHYFNIIELKTAEFMGVCAKLGAMKAGMAAEECDRLYNFGLNLGRAFQIVDDTFDYVEKENIIGKDAGNDFRNGKITLPLLYLLEAASNEEKELLVDCIKNPCKETWHRVKQIVDKYNAIEYCMGKAEEYVDEALQYLEVFPASLYKEKMFDLAAFFIDREY